jgi:drug/metabolite transporter (DMT)-like permease
MGIRGRSYLALVVAAVLWGSLYPAAKPAVAAVGGIQVSLCRAALACLTLSALLWLRGDGALLWRHLRDRWRGILALGLLSFSGSSILAMLATGLLPASVNGLLNNTHPLWIALGTAAFFAPRRPWLLVGGSVLALAGVGLVFWPGPGASVGVGPLSLLGVAVSLGGSGVIALSTVVGRRVMPGADPLAISALASGMGLPPLLALSFAFGGLGPLVQAAEPIKLLLVYLGVGCTAVNFTLWYFGLKHLPAAQASAFQYLIPPVGVVLSALWLGEPITAGLVGGGALILTGLVATQSAISSRRPLPDPAPMPAGPR